MSQYLLLINKENYVEKEKHFYLNTQISSGIKEQKF